MTGSCFVLCHQKLDVRNSFTPHRSFYYAGAFDGGLELFFSQLVNGQQPDGGLFDRFLIQCMLFHHAVLTCPSYKGTSGSFQLSSAARSQVSESLYNLSQVQQRKFVATGGLCITSAVSATAAQLVFGISQGLL